jgi:solute carrier family 13 (sodium-dependent dicarboxylate transporter), member 2/3/5
MTVEAETAPATAGTPLAAVAERGEGRVLLVDDEDGFRKNLARRLEMRGYVVRNTADGEEALRMTRRFDPDVVLLDRKMPGMQGEEVLRELKRLAPEVQVVILTGHANIASAAEAGRDDAFAYLAKPCETEELVRTLEAAVEGKAHAMARHEIPLVTKGGGWRWLWGAHNSRPGVMLLAALLFAVVYMMPAPAGLLALLGAPKAGIDSEAISAYPHYRDMVAGETIAERYSTVAKRSVAIAGPDGEVVERALRPAEAARKGQAMIGVLIVAALLWATGALPIGITAMVVGLLMYLFGVFPPDLVAKAYAKDAVIFILGVLALAVGLGKTGLDRRIGLLLLGTSRSLGAFLFIFCPLLAVSAAFLSEHALVAFLTPLLLVVYSVGIRGAGLSRDKNLAILLLLGLNFAANQGGPGSPAAGGRNAIMIGILGDYGLAPTFGQWMQYGLPFVPVMALVIATYFYFVVRPKVSARSLDVAAIVRAESKKIGAMTRQEYLAAAVLSLVVLLWITASDVLGMGGPALLGVVLLATFRIITWKDVNSISWDVVALYAAASAMGVGLAYTGAALWIAHSLVGALPEALSSGTGLCVASSFLTGVLTNFMSDGATVSMIGPITVPMAAVSGTHPWMVGLSTAFAASFANILVIGTPNNAIVFALAKDRETGEQLITLGDFVRHGIPITLLAFATLWGWAFFGYWPWLGF